MDNGIVKQTLSNQLNKIDIINVANKKELEQIREEMLEHGVIHSTIELENNEDKCNEKVCDIKTNNSGYTHHHHHH